MGDTNHTAELVLRARQKDSDAITALYQQNYNAVFFSIKAKITDQSTIEDLTQDAFVKAFDELDTLDDPGRFTPWVKKIGTNLALMHLRKKKPMLFTELQPEGEEEERELSFTDDRVEASPEAALDRKEVSHLIREILGTLSENQRLAVGLFYYDRYSVKEISAMTGISEGSVKVHLSNGRKRIEEKVRGLEKQGVKLYGVAPIPFLIWLLKTETAAGVAIPTMAAGAAAGTAAAGAASATGSAATAGTVTAKAAGVSLGTKIAAGVTAAALVAGTPFAVAKLQERATEKYYRGYFQSDDLGFYGNVYGASVDVSSFNPEDGSTELLYSVGEMYVDGDAVKQLTVYSSCGDNSSELTVRSRFNSSSDTTEMYFLPMADGVYLQQWYSCTLPGAEELQYPKGLLSKEDIRESFTYSGMDPNVIDKWVTSTDSENFEVEYDTVWATVSATENHPAGSAWVWIERGTHKLLAMSISFEYGSQLQSDDGRLLVYTHVFNTAGNRSDQYLLEGIGYPQPISPEVCEQLRNIAAVGETQFCERKPWLFYGDYSLSCDFGDLDSILGQFHPCE